jgi:hypothetical protein
VEFLKCKSRLDKFSKDDIFKNFEIFSKIVGASVMNEFMNVSVGLKRKRLKITKYGVKANRHEACKNYDHLVGSCSKIQVASDIEGRGKMRRPEEILEMLRRKK